MMYLLAVVLLVLAIGAGYAWGRRASRPRATVASATGPGDHTAVAASDVMVSAPAADAPPEPRDTAPITDERSRLIRSLEAEAAGLRHHALAMTAQASHEQETAASRLEVLADEQRGLLDALAQSRAETARYRQLIIDIENDAPPPLLGGPGTPDDLKLIVGVGPVLERLLHQLGITRYRQIALWSERDIDAFDARLAEFPGRIRRDGWVTQARALHQSTYGEPPSLRERG
ncbi:MAG: hypothetical protein ABJC33_03455 [Betaproteobacteria bacterium]